MHIYIYAHATTSILSAIKQSKIQLEDDITAIDFMQFDSLLNWSTRIFTVSHYISDSDLGTAKKFCINISNYRH